MKIHYYILFITMYSVQPLIADAYKNDVHKFFWASYLQKQPRHASQVRSWYADLFENQPSAYAYKGYIRHLIETNNAPEIIKLSSIIDNVLPDDAFSQFALASAYKQMNNAQESDTRFIRLSSKFPTHPEIVMNATEAYVKRKELKNGLVTLDTFINRSTNKMHIFMFHFMQAQIHAQLGDVPQALTCAQECVRKHPRFDKGWLLCAALQEQIGNLHEAVKGYNKYLENTNDQAQAVQQHLLKLTLKQSNLQILNTVAIGQLSDLDQATLLLEKQQYPQALLHAARHVAQHKADIEGRILFLQILARMNQSEKAISLLCQWIQDNPAQAGPWFEMIPMLAQDQKSRLHAIRELASLEKKLSNNTHVILSLASMQSRVEQYKDAIATYRRALTHIPEKLLKAKIYFQIAALYYDQEKYGELKNLMKEITPLASLFAPLDNMIAYYYATESNNYAQAQQYVNNALQADPHNPHFLDTQALIYYKQGNYTQAIALLENIAQQVPDDATILIHYAKTQAKLGNVEKARTIIAAAQEKATTSYEKKKSKELSQRWKKT